MIDTTIYIKQLIRYYELYQEVNKGILDSFKKVNLEEALAWQDIMDYWQYTSFDFKVNESSEPIPRDDSVVISILGIKLNDDGSMNEELILRLKSGLELARCYPHAYVVVTGGPTAKNNPRVTEGGMMGEWLIHHGLDKKRLIVEDRAMDTIGNAVYTYDLLNKHYPQVSSVVVVSSDYHVARGSLLYEATLRLAALKTKGKKLKVISSVGAKTENPGYETIFLDAWSLCMVAGIDYGMLSVELE